MKTRMSTAQHNPFRENERGFALISVVLIALLVLAYGITFTKYVYTQQKTATTKKDTDNAEQVAEAGVAKAMYCLNATTGANCGGKYGITYAGESNVTVGSGTFTTTLTGSGTTRTISSVGTSTSGKVVTIDVDATNVPQTDSLAFSYALQSGNGGAQIDNNATVNGTMYSGGNVTCGSGGTITGDAYVSSSLGTITGCKVGNDAHADLILSSNVVRDAYYKLNPSGILSTVVGRTKISGSATPAAVSLPTIDLNFWRVSASAGGVINGNYTAANGSTLGPVEIIGNLTTANNAVVTIKGPVWVVGNVTTGNGATFNLDPSFGSYGTMILADDQNNPSTNGKITLSNNVNINGSGDPQSHIVFTSTNTSTSDSSPALSISNNASGAVFYATAGTLELNNNAGAKALAGYRLHLNNNATVTYVQSDFSGYFANSPSGSWAIKKSTWREIH